jgi:hypothetical protein
MLVLTRNLQPQTSHAEYRGSPKTNQRMPAQLVMGANLPFIEDLLRRSAEVKAAEVI